MQDKILVGLQPVGAVAHCWQVLDLLRKDTASCDRPAPTDKAQDPYKA